MVRRTPTTPRSIARCRDGHGGAAAALALAMSVMAIVAMGSADTMSSKQIGRSASSFPAEWRAVEDSLSLETCLVVRGGGDEEKLASSSEGEGTASATVTVEAVTQAQGRDGEPASRPNDKEERSRGSDSIATRWSRWTPDLFSNNARKRFLNQIAELRELLLKSERDADLDLTTKRKARRMRTMKDESNKKQNEDDQDIDDDEDLDAITSQSDLTIPGRHVTIVTTASLPWFTGTAVNPLLRAAHLTRLTSTPVTLMVPWLELEEDRMQLYPGHNFTEPQDQEDFIRRWLREEAALVEESDPKTGVQIIFYPARYHPGMGCIFAMGDICSLLPDEYSDVCILEEPEHLNWYRAPGDGWTKKFKYVIGIVHTNYKEYVSKELHGLWTSPAVGLMSSAMVRAYCHTVIKLSDVLQTFAPEKEKISNVHGVRHDFIKEGARRAEEAGENEKSVIAADAGSEMSNATVYFIGKILWQKGFDIMLEMQNFYKQCTGEYFPIDIYGNGPDLEEIKRAFLGRKEMLEDKRSRKKIEKHNGRSQEGDGDDEADVEQIDPEEAGPGNSTSARVTKLTRETLSKLRESIRQGTQQLELDLPKTRHELRRSPIPATFPGRVDHSMLRGERYNVFVNPSVSEVLCTTTAEALAMGKFVIVPLHPSNEFFMQFPNCLAYRNRWEFAANLRWALTHEPEPLTPELLHQFSWEAGTERLIEAASITKREARGRASHGRSRLDERIAWFHNEMGKGPKGDAIRKVLGAGPVSDQVKYSLEKGKDDVSVEGVDGMSRKFSGSAFARALRTTFADGILFPATATNGASRSAT